MRFRAWRGGVTHEKDAGWRLITDLTECGVNLCALLPNRVVLPRPQDFGDDIVEMMELSVRRIALIVAAVTRAPDGGWRCRSTRRDVLNDDYDAKLHPNFNEVHKWILSDLGRNYVTRDREEALGSLADLLASQSLHTYLSLPAHVDPFEGAERALRSLELVEH